MFKFLKGTKTTSKGDVIFAIAGALVACYKAIDTINEYNQQKENDQ